VPEKLERPEDPLGEAVKFLVPLQQFAPKDVNTHLLAFEIYYRKGKPLLMLQSVKRALSISSTDPRVIGCVLRLQHFIDKKVSMKAPVVEVLEKATKPIFVYQSAKEGIDQFMQKNDKDLEHIFVGAQLLALLNPSNSEKAIKLTTQLDTSLSGVSIRLCTEILDSLSDGKFGPEGVSSAAAYRKKCEAHFEMSSIFSDSPPPPDADADPAAAGGDDDSGAALNNNGKDEQKAVSHNKASAATNNSSSSHLNSKTVKSVS